jgi:hypothetical protein
MQDGVRSGRFGIVNGQSTARQWSFNVLSEAKVFRASNTFGATGRKRGIKDWNGSYGAYGGVPVVYPGEEFTFEGYTAPDSGDFGGDGPIYAGPAIVDSVAIAWNWTNGEIISHTVNFSGMGEIVESVGLYSDITDPDVPEFDGAKITVDPNDGEESGSGSGFHQWCNLLSATLTLTADNKSFVNSCSGGWRSRTPGNLDWTAAVVAQEVSQAKLPFAIGDDVPLRFYITPTTFWRLRWGHVMDFSGLTVNTETGDFIQMTVNFGMSGFTDEGTGLVITPDDTQLWPASP